MLRSAPGGAVDGISISRPPAATPSHKRAVLHRASRARHAAAARYTPRPRLGKGSRGWEDGDGPKSPIPRPSEAELLVFVRGVPHACHARARSQRAAACCPHTAAGAACPPEERTRWLPTKQKALQGRMPRWERPTSKTNLAAEKGGVRCAEGAGGRRGGRCASRPASSPLSLLSESVTSSPAPACVAELRQNDMIWC